GGEGPRGGDCEQAVREPDEEVVADVVAAMEGVLPPDTVREFDQWRQQHARLAFFKSFGRIWEQRPETALTTVGGRAAVVAELLSGLRRHGPRSARGAGERGR